MNRKEGRIPIAKNTDSEGKRTVRVLDGEGKQIGLTYPRRAAGLVKKGRAYYVNDFIIRLRMSDALLPDSKQKSEVMKMDNRIIIDSTNKETENQVLKLYFEPRKWSFNKACADNVGHRSFIAGPDGTLAEGYMLGDWSYHWTEIVSETLLLPKNTDCSFTFWLNGGENDRNDEVCRFEVVFNNDYEQRFTYNLNRNYIRPVKKLNGWELYEIPFQTQDNEYTQLRFVAQKAYMTVLSAKDASAYEGLTGSEDPFAAERPQRHNIVFDDGYPANKWYGTKNLELAHKSGNPASGAQFHNTDVNEQNGFGTDTKASADFAIETKGLADAVGQVVDKLKRGEYVSIEQFEGTVENSGEQVRGIMDKMRNTIQQFAKEFQANASIRLSEISASLDTLSSTCDMLRDIDVESLAGSIRSGQEDDDGDLDDIISDAADAISDMADELSDNIEEITDELEEIKDSLSM